MKTAPSGGAISASGLTSVIGQDACPDARSVSSDCLTSNPSQERGSAYSWVEDYLYRLEGKEERSAYYNWLDWEGRAPAKPIS